MALGDGIGRNKGMNHWTQSRQNDYYRDVKDFIEWLLSNDKYAARDKNTGKLVSGITNPSHKFWQRQGDCESAIRRYNCDRYKRGNYDLELVTYELVEVKEGE